MQLWWIPTAGTMRHTSIPATLASLSVLSTAEQCKIKKFTHITACIHIFVTPKWCYVLFFCCCTCMWLQVELVLTSSIMIVHLCIRWFQNNMLARVFKNCSWHNRLLGRSQTPPQRQIIEGLGTRVVWPTKWAPKDENTLRMCFKSCSNLWV